LGLDANEGGSLEAHPLTDHLKALEEAVFDWLEASDYKLASREEQKVRRMEALVPQNVDAEMPEAYRLWRMCQEHNTMWWDGNMAAQPHILMLEFSVCANASYDFDEERVRVNRIIKRNAIRDG